MKYDSFEKYLDGKKLSKNTIAHYVAYVRSIEEYLGRSCLDGKQEDVERFISDNMGLTQDSAACYKRGYRLFRACKDVPVSTSYNVGEGEDAGEGEEVRKIASDECQEIQRAYEAVYGKVSEKNNWFQEIVVDDVCQWLRAVVRMNSVGGTGFERRSWAFRGQGNSDWGLGSSLGRILFSGHADRSMIARIFENESMWEFSREASRRHELRDYKGADLLALMQHYGCKTRLLDFSLSPLVALYMALEQNKVDFSSGESYVNWLHDRWQCDLDGCACKNDCRPAMSVWAIDLKRIHHKEAGKTVIDSLDEANEILNSSEDAHEKGICLVFPSLCNDRLSAQDGFFPYAAFFGMQV